MDDISAHTSSPEMPIGQVESEVPQAVQHDEQVSTASSAPAAPNPEACTGWMVPARNLVQSLQLGYGYTRPARCSMKEPGIHWEQIIECLGFEGSGAAAHVQDADKHSVQDFFCHLVVSDSADIPANLCDLHPLNESALEKFLGLREVQRPHQSMFVFCEPCSQWADWKLGVETPELALYVCRLMKAYPTLDIDDIGYKLLTKGIPCRTLVKIPKSPRSKTLVDKFKPTSFRPAGYTFVVDDYLEYTHQCETLLNMPQGRAAVLKGGLIACIASEYLGLLYTLAGPSAEITSNKQGFMLASGDNECWADDELTDSELAVLCGTYGMYTYRANQTTIVSWFPPADLWTPGSSRNGRQLIEWTPANEHWYQERVRDILAGNAQPQTRIQWRTWYRGTPQARKLKAQSARRSDAFAAQHLPVIPDIR